jgi:4-hydroxy-tetrahydrodipicolinate reductase
MNIAIIGAAGRMGLAIVRLAIAAGDSVVGAADASPAAHGRDIGELAGIENLGVAVGPDAASAVLGADICIDFSSPKAAPEVARAVMRERIGWVCGTTGIDDAAKKAMAEAAKEVPMLYSANMSVGVQVLAEIVREAVEKLGFTYDVEIVETHHRKKVDAPSGTALRLLEAVQEGRANVQPVFAREGIVGERSRQEVAVLALRGGDVIGDHTVHLLGEGERLELTHRASSRELFAHGSLRAARFLSGKPAGRYAMKDVLAGARAPRVN